MRRDRTWTDSTSPEPDGQLSLSAEGRDLPRGDPARYVEGGHELGRGGLGRVLAVEEKALGREIAKKELLEPDRPGAVTRFLREARITAALEHPGIVPVYELAEDAEGRPYYTMRRARGSTLRDAMTAARTASERLALLPRVVSVCQTLAYAHSRGVVHRDVKPENVMVGAYGETLVLDWGLAGVIGAPDDAPAILHEAADARATVVGAAIGTPAYMSPEQARGDASHLSPRSDVWSLGVVLFELLSGGELPVNTTDGAKAVVARVAAGEVRRAEALSGVPAELVAIVAKALTVDPAARYPDAGAVADDLVAWQQGALVSAYRYGPLDPLLRWAWRYRWGVATALAIVALFASFGVYSVVQIRAERDEARVARAAADELSERMRVGLATSLRRDAAAACEQGDLARCEVMAAESLALVDHPAARGLVVSARSGPESTLLWRVDLPFRCNALATAGDRVACWRQGELVWVSPGGTLQKDVFDGTIWQATSNGQVVLGSDEAVSVIDVATHLPITSVPALGAYAGVTWSGGGLATVDYLGPVRVYAPDGTLTREIARPALEASGVATDPGGQILVAYGMNYFRWWASDGTALPVPGTMTGADAVRVYDDLTVAAMNVTHNDLVLHVLHPGSADDLQLIGHTAAVQAEARDAEGRWFTGAADGTARVWTPEGVEIGRLPTTSWAISDLAATPSAVIVLEQEHMHAWRWKPRLRNTSLGARAIKQINEDRDGTLLVGGESDGILRVDPASGARELVLPLDAPIADVEALADGWLVATKAGDVYRLDEVFRLRWRARVEGPVYTIGVLADRYVLDGRGALVALDPATGAEIAKRADETAVLVTTAGRVFAVGPGYYGVLGSDLSVTDRAAGPERVWSAGVAPDARQIAVGSTGYAEVYDVATHARLARLDFGDRWVDTVEWSDDGALIAVATWDGNVFVYDAATFAELAVIAVRPNFDVDEVRFVQGGRALATGAGDGTLGLWNLDELRAPVTDVVAAVRSRTGLRVVDGTVVDDPDWKPPKR